MTVDWPSIKCEYEHGASKQALSIKHGISRQAIIKKARKDNWITPLVTSPEHFVTSPVTPALLADVPVEVSELSPVEIVEQALARLATFLNDDGRMTLNQHKLFADALSQYIKMKVLLPGGQDSDQAADSLRGFLAQCSNEELAIVRPVIAAVHQRKQEQEEKVKPIRRIG